MLQHDIQAVIDAPLQPVPVTLDEIRNLWHGDEDSLGYHDEELVVEACRLHRPAGVAGAAILFYPGTAIGDLDEDDRDMIERGYALYLRRMDLPVRRSNVAAMIDRSLRR
jgi:hypothetical protein